MSDITPRHVGVEWVDIVRSRIPRGSDDATRVQAVRVAFVAFDLFRDGLPWRYRAAELALLREWPDANEERRGEIWAELNRYASTDRSQDAVFHLCRAVTASVEPGHEAGLAVLVVVQRLQAVGVFAKPRLMQTLDAAGYPEIPGWRFW